MNEEPNAISATPLEPVPVSIPTTTEQPIIAEIQRKRGQHRDGCVCLWCQRKNRNKAMKASQQSTPPKTPPKAPATIAAKVQSMSHAKPVQSAVVATPAKQSATDQSKPGFFSSLLSGPNTFFDEA